MSQIEPWYQEVAEGGEPNANSALKVLYVLYYVLYIELHIELLGLPTCTKDRTSASLLVDPFGGRGIV